MDSSRFLKTEIFNSHVHFENLELGRELGEYLRTLDMPGFAVASYARQDQINSNPEALYIKSLFPDSVYIMGGMDYTGLMKKPPETAATLLSQLETLIKIGFDGIKFLETKPGPAKAIPFSVDDLVYTPFFSRLETEQMPLVWHVADPEEFWDAKRILPIVKQMGWDYLDGTFPAKETLYAQVQQVLDRHPRLKVIFAHFYFLSADLLRAAALLDRHPNVNLDITPGSEMYLGFSKDPARAREFFIKYQDRIIYGDDTCVAHKGVEREGIAKKVFFIRRFLETGESFTLPQADDYFLTQPGTVHGIHLPPEVLKKIYRENFRRLAGPAPRPLDRKAAIVECRRLGDELAKHLHFPEEKNFGYQAAELLKKDL